MLRLFLALWLALTPAFAWAGQSLALLGVGGGTTYQGPGDIVSSAAAWWGLRAYSAAKRGTKAINLCDDLGANCTDISTDATTGNLNNPGTLGSNNCASSNTCKIKIFYDQSGATNCTAAACNLSQATLGSMPTLTFSCFNSLPCAVFAGSQVNTNASFTNFSQPYTTSWVAKRTSGTGFSDVFSTNAGTGNVQVGFSNSANNALTFAGTIVSTAATDNVFHAVQQAFNGASTALNIDGTGSTINPGTNTTASVSIAIGALSTGGNALTGQILEIGFWSSGFSGGQITSMCHNQFVYWGTATSC